MCSALSLGFTSSFTRAHTWILSIQPLHLTFGSFPPWWSESLPNRTTQQFPPCNWVPIVHLPSTKLTKLAFWKMKYDDRLWSTLSNKNSGLEILFDGLQTLWFDMTKEPRSRRFLTSNSQYCKCRVIQHASSPKPTGLLSARTVRHNSSGIWCQSCLSAAEWEEISWMRLNEGVQLPVQKLPSSSGSFSNITDVESSFRNLSDVWTLQN